jgi:hypothetical protein
MRATRGSRRRVVVFLAAAVVYLTVGRFGIFSPEFVHPV